MTQGLEYSAFVDGINSSVEGDFCLVVDLDLAGGDVLIEDEGVGKAVG